MSDIMIEKTSIIDEDVKIGKGTIVGHFSHLEGGAEIGEDCRVGQNVFVGRSVKMGKGCQIENNVSIYSGVVLGDYVFCGPSCMFTNELTPQAKYPRANGEVFRTVVKEGATIGANSTIVCGHTLGEWSMVAAGAIVTKDVPNHALMVGVPAKRIGWVCECGAVLKDGLTCGKCGRRYYENKDGLREEK